MKKFISFIIAIVMLASIAAVPAFAEQEFVFPDENWGADENGDFLISDVPDLLAFSVSAQINNYYAGKTVKLVEDIDMTNIEWMPVSNFKGTFDGQGHAIKGVTLQGQSGQLGFFTAITDATIQNIRFLDFNVSVVSADGSNSAGLIACKANNRCVLKNVYTSGTVATGATRAAGMIGFPNTQHTGVIVFENCVSAVKCIGQRASGFVAQIHPYTSIEFTDCAFIGDLSEAGRWSSGFTGLTVGNVKMTRCISLANVESAKSKEIGSLVFIDHQNNAQAKEAKSQIILEDCYAATADEYYAIGTQATRGWSFKLTVKYGGETVYDKQRSEEATLTDDRTAIEAATKYLAKGATVNVTKDTFANVCTGFTGWTALDTTVDYAEGRSINVFVPTAVKELMVKPFEPKVEEPKDTEPEATEPEATEPEATEPEATEGDATTKAPDNNDASDKTDDKKGGCSGAIGASAVAVFAVVGGAMMVARKKKED